jgi:hypothetical protein
MGKTKHTELTLDQIASMQPGLGWLMPIVSDRYWIAYYAAHGGNWALSAHEIRELAKLLQQGALTRPQYEPQLTAYERTAIGELLQAIAAHDLVGFDAAFRKGTDVANSYHKSLGHPEIVWRLPRQPPDHLDLSATFPDGPSDGPPGLP